MSKHTLALIIVTLLLAACIFLVALMGVWFGWFSVLEAFFIACGVAISSLILELIRERKKKKQSSQSEDRQA
ncbi:hypothetical protein HQ45_07655 [Porphyromonas crevioricanis]|uniref:Uncharacterized protein n=2 Tax=Porphyromonas crevioricanis TaxID=393921 RepID=A0A0A2G1T1_9PORP|nr:hypothetical protein [Porphyromonas crevioricanis]KGN89394.1 hypothetical protein HQ45_07655 [Porphyromonas crevioricanis]KGN96387.1 hypothetical protein HQ38_01670 [Porphyromonas crevioricanis]SJZ86733.1 hypothetical protein SAMN02745203_01098 [Porphyromonas crevioricanis]SQH73190.1 Uncharacterised protein [Porphyromonas crevioricanis]GAD05318.1 hypothetical protein PORCRE_1018 [Porphyromonas crevioricanis JCM 15906]